MSRLDITFNTTWIVRLLTTNMTFMLFDIFMRFQALDFRKDESQESRLSRIFREIIFRQFTLNIRDGFGPGPAQGPTDLGWAGPKNFGPNPSLISLRASSSMILLAS